MPFGNVAYALKIQRGITSIIKITGCLLSSSSVLPTIKTRCSNPRSGSCFPALTTAVCLLCTTNDETLRSMRNGEAPHRHPITGIQVNAGRCETNGHEHGTAFAGAGATTASVNVFPFGRECPFGELVVVVEWRAARLPCFLIEDSFRRPRCMHE